MIVEDFYSTQSRLRQEQAELLSLLKDDSCTWPSSSLNKETEGCNSSSLRHQKMKVDSKRPSRPPGSASCSSSGSPNTSMSEDDEDGCEIVRHHRRRPRTSARSVTTKPPTGAALEAEKSIYHSGCNPKQPNRSFRARPVPRGILKDSRSPNRRARSVGGYINSSRGRHDGNVGLVPVPKGILKTNHYGTPNGKSPSRNEGSCSCCTDHLAFTADQQARYNMPPRPATASGNCWPHQPQPPSLPVHHPDHPFHLPVCHCHTANTQWRPKDQVAVLETTQNGGCFAETQGSAQGVMPKNIRNPIALKSRNTIAAVSGKTSSSIDLFYNGLGGQQPQPQQQQRRRGLHGGGALDSNTAKVQKQQQQEPRSHHHRPLGKKNGKTEAIPGSKTTSSSSTSSWSSKNWCGLCHCYDCYQLYNERQKEEKESQKAAAASASESDEAVVSSLMSPQKKDGRTGDTIPWTEDWFHQMVQFRKEQCWSS